MRYPVDNFLSDWNTTAGNGFGIQTSYGFHEAVDLNLNGGGNIDLGQPLFAVADGEITSIHIHTTSPTFGKHLHLKFNIDGKDYWAHYAHCDEIFVAEGQKVKKGDKIATCGNSGTTYAHLHFAIKNQPTGVDGLAKTQEDLKKWENPIAFIEKHLFEEPMATITQKELDQLRLDRDTHFNDLKKAREDNMKLVEDIKKEQNHVTELLQQLEKLNDEDKSTSEQLLDAQKLLEPYKSALNRIVEALGLVVESTPEEIVQGVIELKESKVKYLKTSKMTFRERLLFLIWGR